MPDLPPQPADQDVKIIEQRLVACGLDRRGFRITYDEDIQGYWIEVSREANAKPEAMSCIWGATRLDYVQFDDPALTESYQAIQAAHLPDFRKEAEAELERRGFLAGLPRQSQFATLDEFSAALERHCGFAPREVLKVEGGEIRFEPEQATLHQWDREKISCLMAELSVSGSQWGLVGNEAVGWTAEPNQ